MTHQNEPPADPPEWKNFDAWEARGCPSPRRRSRRTDVLAQDKSSRRRDDSKRDAAPLSPTAFYLMALGLTVLVVALMLLASGGAL